MTDELNPEEILEGVLEICDKLSEGRCGSSEADGAANCAFEIREKYSMPARCSIPCTVPMHSLSHPQCRNRCHHTEGHDGQHICWKHDSD